MIGNDKENSAEDDHAINRAGDPINHEPASFAFGIGGTLGFFDPKEVTFKKKTEMLIGTLREVRNFQEVAEDEITIEAQERIGVEKDG